MLNHKEVLEALLRGDVIKDIGDSSIKYKLDQVSNRVVYLDNDNTWKAGKGLYLTDWELEPKTILINNMEVLEPLRETPLLGSNVHVTSLVEKHLYYTAVWDDSPMNYDLLHKGILHKTKEAAIAHAKALLSFTERSV